MKHDELETIFTLIADQLYIVMPKEIANSQRYPYKSPEEIAESLMTCARSAGAVGNLCTLLGHIDLAPEVRKNVARRVRHAFTQFNALVDQLQTSEHTKRTLRVDMEKLPVALRDANVTQTKVDPASKPN